MPQVINTNVASLNAQRNLNKSQGSLQTALQRLSSGLRINSAKDDAAGLAITDRMTAQIKGMNQASRNAADAISLAQTGEAALQELTNNLQRMRELAVQSRNATNTEDDRASLDAEFQQLLSEVDRIAETTAFNGRKILDGSMTSSEFQVGANVGETITIDISSSMRASAIGAYASKSYSLSTNASFGGGVTTGTGDTSLWDGDTDIDINGTSITAPTGGTAGTGPGSALAAAAAINAFQADTGVTATAGPAEVTISAADIASYDYTEVATVGTATSYAVSLNGESIFTQSTAGANTTQKSNVELASLFNSKSADTGVVAKANDDGSMTLTAADGRNIELTEVSTKDDATDSITGYFGQAAQTGADVDSLLSVAKGSVTIESDAEILVEFTTGDAADELFGESGNATDTASVSYLSAADVLTTTNSDLAIEHIDESIKNVDTLRGTFGAVQSRFESTIASLQAASENVSAARSRILDADFAMETANLTKAQILQQAGVSVLAQANGLPQSVLALLQ